MLLVIGKTESPYIVQYPVIATAQRTLHITSLADIVNKTPSQRLWGHPTTLQLMRDGYSYKYLPVYTARYSSLQLSELEQRRMENCPRFHTAAQVRIRVLLVDSPTFYP